MRLVEHDVVLVTGGASGLGAATVRGVIAEGASALILDLPSSAGAELVAELGERVRFAAADVRDEDQVQAAVAAARDFGTLRVVVNCAGVGTPGRVIGKHGVLPLEAFQTVIDINLVGTFNVLRLAAAAMIDNEPLDGDRGLVIMTASVAAFDGQIGQAAYAASKGAVASLTLPAARELARFGIRVVSIAPGVFETPMVGTLPPEAQQSLAAQVPFPRRLGRPQEFADLASQAIENRMLNGVVLRLDGALRMSAQ